MESWGFDSLDKGYTSNETLSSSDSIFRSKNVLLGWEFKPPFSCDSNLVVPNQHLVENPGFPEVGIAEILRKQFPHDSVRDVFSSNVGDIFRPSIVNFNAISGDEESSSKIATSVVDSNSRESSLIDLKLGGFSDNLKSNSPRAAPILSSVESSTPAKRARAMSLTCQTAYCQVYGCNKDLSFAKDYHKRHKVCDVHSKTAKVIVNGIEQRFCQQCSRFHLLAEFDDGKRSCRKRLAGHNERRRKPQVGFGNNRSGRSLHSYPGSIGNKLQGNALAATSFICQDILGPSRCDKYPTNSWNKDIKVEDGASMYGQLEHKSVLTPYLFEKPYTSVINSINGHGQGRIFTENINQYPHEIVSRSLFQTNSLGSEEMTLFDTASAIQGIPGMSESSCALSLLSSQSQNSPCHSPTVPSANPSIIQNSSPHFGLTQLFGSQGLTTERNYPSTMPMLDDGHVDFANGTVQGSGYVNVKESLSCEDGTTIDLLQLSSQLQRVENQRQLGPVKPENERFLLS